MRSTVLVALSVATLLGCRDLPRPVEASRFARAGWTQQTLNGVGVQILTPGAAAPLEGRPLLIALHGCAQSANELVNRVDFGSVAEAFDAVVAVPTVPNGGKYFGCWNYYGPNHSRTSGDAGKILELVDALLSDPDLGVDPGRVWIAGLSSGGGMAMVMGCVAPDVFAGVGIAAGPTVGTTAFQTSQVGTNLTRGRNECTALAGPAAPTFDTQLVSIVAGTNDYVVSQAYATLNADVFASIYATGGPALTTSPLTVSALEGYNPAGTGTVHADADGPRIQRISVQGMGHAWPAGTGSGPELGFVASQGVDWAWTLADFFSTNSRRTDPVVVTDPGDDEPDTTTEPDPDTTEPTDPDTEPTVPGACDPWVEAVEDDVNGHLSRYDVYPAGYGVADRTYVDLLDDHGVFGPFVLYVDEAGDWYADPASMPARACP